MRGRTGAAWAGLGLGLFLGSAACAADPKDVIKAYKFEIRPLELRHILTSDPFRSRLPLESQAVPDSVKVRIISLYLTSVIVGRQKVAIFRELHGPSYSYILVNGVLLGPDRKPLPGIAGTIDPIDARGDYTVVLKQGGEVVRFSQVRSNPSGQRALPSELSKDGSNTGSNAPQGGGS